MEANQMEDREGKLDQVFGASSSMTVRQTRRGCIPQLIGCEMTDEFKWFDTTDGKNEHFGTSLEESDCCPRVCCNGCHEFTMVAKEEGSGEEVLTMHRPWACCMAPCKCCCYQTMSYSYAGKPLGQLEEQPYCCVPRMLIKDDEGAPLYKVHSPTCCMGKCIYCCAEGNPCFGRGCCKVPFYVYPASQEDTDNGAPFVGKIVKVPKSLRVELFTDAEAFDVLFPTDATPAQKAMIAGSAVLINANFFEGDQS